jgi:hypothetical protein
MEMARPPKSIRYDATAAVIQRYFDEAMTAKNEQKIASAEISTLNQLMQQDGVHAGLLSYYCKIARMKPEKAALWLALDDFYRQALASRLPNPKTGAEVRPFGSARGAMAA